MKWAGPKCKAKAQVVYFGWVAGQLGTVIQITRTIARFLPIRSHQGAARDYVAHLASSSGTLPWNWIGKTTGREAGKRNNNNTNIHIHVALQSCPLLSRMCLFSPFGSAIQVPRMGEDFTQNHCPWAEHVIWRKKPIKMVIFSSCLPFTHTSAMKMLHDL